MEAFIRERGVTICPPGTARGTDYHKPTATGYGTPESFVHRESSAKCNEMTLAQAKILTMFEDLGGKGRGDPSARIKHQNDAYRWFFNSSNRADFEAWCDTAGYEPDYVRERAREIHEQGLPQWRADAGQGKKYEERRAYRMRTGK